MKMFLLSVLVAVVALSKGQSAPEVQLSSGIAQGYQKSASETSLPYNVYYGIPFAEPPVNELRFMAPVPFVGSPDTVLTSDTFKPACINYPGPPTLVQSEDCLTLNVFTPSDASPDNVKKVLVFIHGGAFTGGAASYYEPTALVTTHDIIVVTIQYRLSAFGYLSAGDDVLPGNMGLRDQLMSVQWVKDNIASFGGDASDITVSGESAGAMSTSALSIIPQSKDLFTKVILQSGTVLSSLAVKNDPQETFKAVAAKANCANEDTKTVVECLQSASLVEIMQALPLIFPTFDTTFTDQVVFTIVGTDTELFPKPPVELMQDKDYLEENGILSRKYLAGVLDNEGLLIPLVLFATGQDPVVGLTQPNNVDALIKSVMKRYLKKDPPQSVLDAAAAIYAQLDSNGKIDVQKVIDLQDDDLFTIPLFLFTHDLLLADSDVEVYTYLFDSEIVLFDPNGSYTGTCHTMDLVFEFDSNPNLEGVYFYGMKDPVKFPITQSLFRGYIGDFVNTGNPVSADSTAWPRYELDSQKYMYICSNPEVREVMYPERLALWEETIPKLI